LAPGGRLPTHKQLERRFDAESPTIRAAMGVLADEGFVETRPRQGSFVAAQPPHLTQFALVFPFSPERSPSQFYRAIRAEAERWQSPERRVLPFYDIDVEAEMPDYQRLLRLVESERLAGLIFAANPFALRFAGSPVTEAAGLPRVMIETDPDFGGYPSVYPDLASFAPRAFAHLSARHCRRVAVVMLPSMDMESELLRLVPLAAAHGLTLKPHWLQAATPSAGTWIRQLGRLLMNGEPGERPDGLVIADDNLVPELTAGLAADGPPVRAAGEALGPGDLAVVAHTNYPHPTPAAVPVARLGYDIPKLVATCMERIDQQRRGETPPPVTVLPPLFEEEWAVTESRSHGVTESRSHEDTLHADRAAGLPRRSPEGEAKLKKCFHAH